MHKIKIQIGWIFGENLNYTPPPVYKDNNFLGQQLHFFCQTGQQLLDNTYFLGKKLDNTKIVVLIYGGVYIRTFTTWLLSLDL